MYFPFVYGIIKAVLTVVALQIRIKFYVGMYII